MRNIRTNFQHRPKKNSLIIGLTKVVDAMQNGEQIEKIYLSNALHGQFTEEIRKLAEGRQIPINKVPVEKLTSFNVDDHGGCIAVKGKIKYQDLQTVISFEVDKGEVPLFLILDGITDIRNIGALARTAYCCGVHAIIIADKGVGALNEDAIATSAGALELISVCRVSSLVRVAEELHLNGIKIFASELNAEKKIFDINFKEPCAIIMGSEDKGISPSLLKVCDEIFSIPMISKFDSLNVSVAAGMTLYEAMKQRL
ncbi:MAG: 23S rRNA (guanosine(2251)-2'-O)-methyltransferase RlmB [Ginsengibacter sp.]